MQHAAVQRELHAAAEAATYVDFASMLQLAAVMLEHHPDALAALDATALDLVGFGLKHTSAAEGKRERAAYMRGWRAGTALAGKAEPVTKSQRIDEARDFMFQEYGKRSIFVLYGAVGPMRGIERLLNALRLERTDGAAAVAATRTPRRPGSTRAMSDAVAAVLNRNLLLELELASPDYNMRERTDLGCPWGYVGVFIKVFVHDEEEPRIAQLLEIKRRQHATTRGIVDLGVAIDGEKVLLSSLIKLSESRGKGAVQIDFDAFVGGGSVDFVDRIFMGKLASKLTRTTASTTSYAFEQRGDVLRQVLDKCSKDYPARWFPPSHVRRTVMNDWVPSIHFFRTAAEKAFATANASQRLGYGGHTVFYSEGETVMVSGAGPGDDDATALFIDQAQLLKSLVEIMLAAGIPFHTRTELSAMTSAARQTLWRKTFRKRAWVSDADAIDRLTRVYGTLWKMLYLDGATLVKTASTVYFSLNLPLHAAQMRAIEDKGALHKLEHDVSGQPHLVALADIGGTKEHSNAMIRAVLSRSSAVLDVDGRIFEVNNGAVLGDKKEAWTFFGVKQGFSVVSMAPKINLRDNGKSILGAHSLYAPPRDPHERRRALNPLQHSPLLQRGLPSTIGKLEEVAQQFVPPVSVTREPKVRNKAVSHTVVMQKRLTFRMNGCKASEPTREKWTASLDGMHDIMDQCKVLQLRASALMTPAQRVEYEKCYNAATSLHQSPRMGQVRVEGRALNVNFYDIL